MNTTENLPRSFLPFVGFPPPLWLLPEFFMNIHVKINPDFLLPFCTKYSTLFALFIPWFFKLNISWKFFHLVHRKHPLSFLLLPGIFLCRFTVTYLTAPLWRNIGLFPVPHDKKSCSHEQPRTFVISAWTSIPLGWRDNFKLSIKIAATSHVGEYLTICQMLFASPATGDQEMHRVYRQRPVTQISAHPEDGCQRSTHWVCWPSRISKSTIGFKMDSYLENMFLQGSG